MDGAQQPVARSRSAGGLCHGGDTGKHREPDEDRGQRVPPRTPILIHRILLNGPKWSYARADRFRAQTKEPAAQCELVGFRAGALSRRNRDRGEEREQMRWKFWYPKALLSRLFQQAISTGYFDRSARPGRWLGVAGGIESEAVGRGLVPWRERAKLAPSTGLSLAVRVGQLDRPNWSLLRKASYKTSLRIG